MSEEQKIFLKKRKKERILIKISQIFLIIIFLSLWEFLASSQIINPFIYSSPSRIVLELKSLIINNSLFVHIGSTLYEIIIAFCFSIAIGFCIAVMLYVFPFIAKVLDPFFTILNSLPKVALGPIIIIIAGANIKSIIVMAILINIIVTITTIYNGFNNTDNLKIKLFNTFGATKRQILKYLVIPNSYTTIISSLKLTMSLTLIGVISGEFLISKQGIGYLIIYGTQVFNLDLVMAGIVTLLLISYILYIFIVKLEKKLIN